MTDIVFVDCETTGLDPQEDTIIEVALIKGSQEMARWFKLKDEELGRASPQALRINRYYKRASLPYPLVLRDAFQSTSVMGRGYEAARIAKMLEGCILAGNNVKFDQQFLGSWLRRHGACPVWDYHVLDVPTFAAGWMTNNLQRLVEEELTDQEKTDSIRDSLRVPFSSGRISKALGVAEPEDEEKHTALGDARWSKRMWDVLV